MLLTIGQTIKKLRKERNFTQEELAEQLNVTSQAVSKWENETGLPDISQIVPLASVFGVSTDVLFGTFGTNDDEEVKKIIDEAYYSFEVNSMESLRRRYDILQDGLRRYPNNVGLLVNCLETGNGLAYPENNDFYDAIHWEEIYKECIRMANVLFSIPKNVNINDILRAHMIMVTLHSAYGNIDKAREHAENFPWRSDMTAHVMSAYIAHAEKNYADEAKYCERDILFHYEAMFCSMAQLGDSYRYMKKYDDALKMFEKIFKIIEIICADKPVMPPLHYRERGDAHVLIAKTYLEMNDKSKALEWLEKMVDYDVNVLPQIKDKKGLRINIKQRLLKKLSEAEFENLKNNGRFLTLLNRANALDG